VISWVLPVVAVLGGAVGCGLMAGLFFVGSPSAS
jgi:uncharacterized membrane protein